MREIWIPELVSSLFILVFLVRPLFKGLWPLDGIAWFPVLALAAVMVIFPAYGFRPECIPLLINHGFIALMNLSPLFVGAGRNTAFHERGALFTAPALICLFMVTGAALWFAPWDRSPVNARQLVVWDQEASKNYTLYIFDEPPAAAADSGNGASSGLRPVIFVAPPDFGQVNAVDGLCAALGNRGFAVISYTCQGRNTPWRLIQLWQSFSRGTVQKKANDQGRALEAERRKEIEFLLPYIRGNLAALAPNADGNSFFLVGWDSGGAALAAIASSGGSGPGASGGVGGRFAEQAAAYGALVVVESRFYASWEAGPQPEPVSGGPQPLSRALAAVRNWFARLQPEKTGGLGAIPQPKIPVLYLVSGRALENNAAAGDYAALLAAFYNAPGPAALAALETAGPLDYTDFPMEYPLYTALFRGRGAGESMGIRRDLSGDAAALIARFCRLVAAGTAGTNGTNGAAGAGTVSSGLYLDTRYWNFGDLRLY
jgi:hypothetical protein